MIGVQKWTTTKGPPSLVFFCNFLLSDQSGRPASGSESRISSYFPPLSRAATRALVHLVWVFLSVKPSFCLVVVLRSRFSCGSNQIQGHGGVIRCQ